MFFFIIFKLIGYKQASDFGNFLGRKLGPIFRSKDLIRNNINRFDPSLKDIQIRNISENMWGNYGRIFSDYMFLSAFRKKKLENFLNIEGLEKLQKIKSNKEPVIFISGHFSNFELMAMVIEREGLRLSAIYRPLNNKFLNLVMENLRKKYICEKQIKKGLQGVRQSLSNFKKGSSLAIMIDQRVSEGIESKFFSKNALTTTIPAQFVKKFKCMIQPVHISRVNKYYFNLIFDEPITFKNDDSVEYITNKLNLWLESQIRKYPDQWIWSHNRWKH